jgi:penicillin-binding protein 2
LFKRIDKYHIVYFIVILASSLLLLKATQLQLVSETYKVKEQNVTLNRLWQYPGRGLIYDRNGKLLVKNEPVYQLKVVFNELNPKMDTNLICTLLHLSKYEFKKRMNVDWSNYRFSKNIPFVFLSKIEPEVFANFSEHLYEFPGFYPEVKNIRNYLYPNAAHVLGYIGEVDEKKIAESNGEYLLGDYIGITGLEQSHETELRGKRGVKFELKDNMGRIVEPYKNGALDTPAVAGYDVFSSIDIDLQAYGELLMKNKRGAIVAIDPSTGEILAMVSSPGYNPSDLAVKNDRGRIFKQLLEDSINKPLLNRAVSSKYPPGSIFKPILGLVTMQMRVTEPDRFIACNGKYIYKTKYHIWTYKCHHHAPTHNISIALQHSCNSYFFQLAREGIEKYGYTKPGLGLDTIVSYLKDFGLGSKLGIDLKNESKGFVPSAQYYDSIYKRQKAKWRSTYIMSLGIGQGELEFTTLQIANLAAVIGNRGYFYTPHLVKKFSNNHPVSNSFRKKNIVRINKKYFQSIIDGMELAVMDGTALNTYVPGLSICGKTGTSENFTIINGKRVQLKDNSVFMGFAPKYNPKIAIAVYVENAGFGGDVAAPLGSLVIEKYLNDEIAFYRAGLQRKLEAMDLNSISPVVADKKAKIPQNQDSLSVKKDTTKI